MAALRRALASVLLCATIILSACVAAPLYAEPDCALYPEQCLYYTWFYMYPPDWCEYESGDRVTVRFSSGGVPDAWYVVPAGNGGGEWMVYECEIYYVIE